MFPIPSISLLSLPVLARSHLQQHLIQTEASLLLARWLNPQTCTVLRDPPTSPVEITSENSAACRLAMLRALTSAVQCSRPFQQSVRPCIRHTIRCRSLPWQLLTLDPLNSTHYPSNPARRHYSARRFSAPRLSFLRSDRQ
jgi:hypothetical protein